MSLHGSVMGEVLKNQSDSIMDATFTRDIAYRKCYIINKGAIFPQQTIDGYRKAKAVYSGKDVYDPSTLNDFKPIDAKYLVHTYYSVTSDDQVDYYLQFRPTAHKDNENIRIGALVFIPDDIGVYHLWMIVAKDDRPQFPQFYVLKCDFLVKWNISQKEVPLFEGKKVDLGTYFSWSVLRSQNSYNSGVWTDYATTSVENQKKMWLPTNEDTYTLTYNRHIVISNNPYRRVAWEVSKVEDTSPFGVTKITFKQELENDDVDNSCWVNVNSDNISSVSHGANYDYYNQRVSSDTNDNSLSGISFTGIKQSIKVGGSYKTLTANSYSGDGSSSSVPKWSIYCKNNNNTICILNLEYNNGNLVPNNNRFNFNISKNKVEYYFNGDLLFGIKYLFDPTCPNQLKVKCLPVANMVGNKIIVVVDDDQSENANGTASIELEVDEV